MGTQTYNAGWFTRHPDYSTSKSRLWRRKERLRILNARGACCVWCGYDNVISLDFDHVFDDGHLTRGKSGGGSDRLTAIKRHPELFQILCKNCNWIKEYERRRDAKQRSNEQVEDWSAPLGLQIWSAGKQSEASNCYYVEREAERR